MNYNQVFNILNFIGDKVPKYKLEPAEGNDYKLGDVLLTPTGAKAGLFKDDKVTPLNPFDKNYIGVGYKYTQGRLLGKNTYVNGVRTGPMELYFDDGTIQCKGNEKDNHWDGEFESYYREGGVQTKGQYVMGKKDGEWKMFFKDGNIEEIENFDAGRITSKVIYYKNGSVEESASYVDGQLDGVQLSYHANGKLHCRREYDHGFELKRTVYYENGELASVIEKSRNGYYRMIQYNKEGKVESDYSEGQP